MHYTLGGPEHFEDAPERARVRLEHDDGRQFYATDRTLGSDFWYIDGKKISKAATGMGAAIYHRTRVVARRSAVEPKPNWGSVPGLGTKTAGASEVATIAKEQEASRTRDAKRKYAASKGNCARHDIEYAKTYGCKECRKEQRAHKVAETVQPLAVNHVWGEIKSSDPETITVCQSHGVSHDVKGECYKCVQEATPPVEEIRKVTPPSICAKHNVLLRDGEPCIKCLSQTFDTDTPAEPEAPAKLCQVGGDHYDRLSIDIFQFCEENNIGFVLSTAIKYLARKKGESRMEDLQKAINCIQRQIKFEETGSWER